MRAASDRMPCKRFSSSRAEHLASHSLLSARQTAGLFSMLICPSATIRCTTWTRQMDGRLRRKPRTEITQAYHQQGEASHQRPRDEPCFDERPSFSGQEWLTPLSSHFESRRMSSPASIRREDRPSVWVAVLRSSFVAIERVPSGR